MQTFIGIAVIFATIAGPILAVLVTRYVDDRRALKSRQLEIFRALMSSRRTILSPERVRALNVVEIEFYKNNNVQIAYKAFMSHINTSPSENNKWADRHNSLFTKLLTEVATTLAYKMQQLDVMEGGYYPQGFFDIELEQQNVRKELLQVLTGRRPIITAQSAPTPPPPFPPPPTP